MEKPVDQRGKLAENPFDYQVTKDNRVIIFWRGKQVKTLAGKPAEKLLSALDSADAPAIQLALAKATGNFKHGNERAVKG